MVLRRSSLWLLLVTIALCTYIVVRVAAAADNDTIVYERIPRAVGTAAFQQFIDVFSDGTDDALIYNEQVYVTQADAAIRRAQKLTWLISSRSDDPSQQQQRILVANRIASTEMICGTTQLAVDATDNNYRAYTASVGIPTNPDDETRGVYQYQQRRVHRTTGVETILNQLNFTETHDYPEYNAAGDITGWTWANSSWASELFIWPGYNVAVMRESPSHVHVVALIALASKWLVYSKTTPPQLLHSTMINLPVTQISSLRPFTVRQLPAPVEQPQQRRAHHVNDVSASSKVITVKNDVPMDVVAITTRTDDDNYAGLQKWLNWTFDSSIPKSNYMSTLLIFIDQSSTPVTTAPTASTTEGDGRMHTMMNQDITVGGVLAYAEIIVPPKDRCTSVAVRDIVSSYDSSTGIYRLVIAHDCRVPGSDQWIGTLYILDLMGSTQSNGDCASMVSYTSRPVATGGRWLYFDEDHSGARRSTMINTLHLMQHGHTVVVGGMVGYWQVTTGSFTEYGDAFAAIWSVDNGHECVYQRWGTPRDDGLRQLIALQRERDSNDEIATLMADIIWNGPMTHDDISISYSQWHMDRLHINLTSCNCSSVTSQCASAIAPSNDPSSAVLPFWATVTIAGVAGVLLFAAVIYVTCCRQRWRHHDHQAPLLPPSRDDYLHTASRTPSTT